MLQSITLVGRVTIASITVNTFCDRYVQLAAFFLQEVTDEQFHAQFLANKIVALGDEPTAMPAPIPEITTNREILESVLVAEMQTSKDYTKWAMEADELGDKGLVVALEDMVRDETGHSERSNECCVIGLSKTSMQVVFRITRFRKLLCDNL